MASTTDQSQLSDDQLTTERDRLRQLTAEFLDAFNRGDLDAVVSSFASDGMYDEFTGQRNEGLDEIRTAFEPQFSGAFGEMKFLDEDLFIDASTGQVMASWVCTLSVKGEPTSWRGLDLITYRGDEVVAKSTYAKTKAPRFA